VSDLQVIGRLDPSFGWDGERLLADGDVGGSPLLRGAFSSVSADRGVVRDPLGINKLFWCVNGETTVMAARVGRLVDEGHAFRDVRAVPRGYGAPGAELGTAGERDVRSAAREIRESLDAYVAAIAAAHPSATAYVCLSGGLDSSGIATIVRDHFPNAVAVSFDLARSSGPSDDRTAAERVARELNMPLLTTTVDDDELLSHLDTVLVEGVDWRDFNVHAGLVNAALATFVADQHGDPVVFTGDLANEFLVDYHAETYRGETYYALPRLSPAALRAGLVRGLDSCHREVGVFGAWGLPVVQPYAVAVDAYLALPEDFLGLAERKERLCREVFGDRLPSFVLSRPKTRAQLGGDDGDGGVLAACVNRGIDRDVLKARWAKLHGVADWRELDRFIRAGRYRSAPPSTAGGALERA
jgi:asparagine synthetase B (glutamine-hydrolysing)